MPNEIPEITAIVTRLDKLERQNRRFKQAGLLLLLGVGALLVLGQAAPERRVIRAREFVVEDSAGVKRASLGIDETHPKATGLSLYNSAGKSIAGLSAFGNLSFLTLSGDAATLGITGDISTLLMYPHPAAGGPKISLLADSNGSVVSVEGQPLISGKAPGASLSTLLGNPHFSLTDGDGHERVQLSLTNNGPLMAFLDSPQRGQELPRLGVGTESLS